MSVGLVKGFDYSQLLNAGGSNSSNSGGISSSVGSLAGTAIAGPVGGVVGGLLGNLLSGQNGYLSNFGGFLETGSLSCLGRQAYRKDTLDYLVRDIKTFSDKGPEQLANFLADKVSIYSFDAGRLRSACSRKWCKSCLNVCVESYKNLNSKYKFTTSRSTVRWGSDTLDSTKHKLVVDRVVSPIPTNGVPSAPVGVMSQDEFLVKYGKELASFANSKGLDVNEVIANAYQKMTGIKWNFGASSGGNGVNWSFGANNNKSEFPWLLVLLVGGGFYLLSNRK